MSTDKLTKEEYTQSLSGLYEIVKSEAKASDTEASLLEKHQHLELNLTIDFKLGRFFSRENRHKLWEIQLKSLQKSELLKKEYSEGKLDNKNFAAKMQELATHISSEFSKVLSEKEFNDFFEGSQTLALDPEQMK